MVEEIHIVIANPAGNITILVTDEIEQCERVIIANRLLGIPDWKAEQVGFIASPQMGGAGRLEMMGMEFCGNALRSFGYYLAREENLKKGSVLVEISGTNELFDVSVDTKQHTAWTKMPIPYKLTYVKVKKDQMLPMVLMDGIQHVIVENEKPDEALTRRILDAVYQQNSPEAAGILYICGGLMEPVVYVQATDTLVHENSCGSGSIAYAYYLARNDFTEYFHEKIKQPGGIIETKVIKEKGHVKECMMGGRIELSHCMTVRL